MSGALQATAHILKICQKAKSAREIKREVETFRDWLLSGAADDVRSQMPRRK
jgi:hypothetical protein